MLHELIVENLAVVERLRVRFGPGLNAVTGETGSGKSIVVDALGLLLGERASSEMVRTGCDRARISGIFEPTDAAAVQRALEASGIDYDPGDELLIEREVLASGKSRAFVCSRPSTTAVLRELAPYLGDIHGQHDQQRLFSESEQLAMLDEYAGLEESACGLGTIFRDWHACNAELQDLERTEQEKLRLLDLWQFQRKEIETLGLKEGEDVALENELRVLSNVVKLQESAGKAYLALYEDESSTVTTLRLALKRVDELARIDMELAEVAETLKPALIAVEEAARTLQGYMDGLEADPSRLEEVQSRLATIERLKRKYGGSVAAVLQFLARVRQDIDAIENSEAHRASIEKRRKELGVRYEKLAQDLSAKRQKAALQLSKGVEKELAALAMGGTRFVASLAQGAWTARGVDTVEFLLSANLGEEPRPLDRIASGGELSRVALALKTVIAAKGGDRGKTPRTLVFDEVDAGIGGAAGESVGRRLKGLAESAQVLCVTHLAQIAGFADQHFSVRKQAANGRTMAAMQELQGELRTREIGRMLSGENLTPEALKHAEQLIRTGR